MIGNLTKFNLNSEGLRIFQLLTVNYGMSEDKALKLIKEVIVPLINPLVAKSRSAADDAVIRTQRQEIVTLKKRNNDLFKQLKAEG